MSGNDFLLSYDRQCRQQLFTKTAKVVENLPVEDALVVKKDLETTFSIGCMLWYEVIMCIAQSDIYNLGGCVAR